MAGNAQTDAVAGLHTGSSRLPASAPHLREQTGALAELSREFDVDGFTAPEGVVCIVDGCGRGVDIKSFGLCQGHRRQQRKGLPFTAIPRKAVRPGRCDFAPCKKPKKILHWCKTHYFQQYQGLPMRMTRRRFPATRRDEQGRKRCSTCEEWQAESEFARAVGKADDLQSRCRKCYAKIRRRGADELRDKMWLARFNISCVNFDALLESQGGRCAVCRTGATGGRYWWSIDHDHDCCPDTGKSCGKCIRGILCGRCKTAIGLLAADADRIRDAANHIARH